MYGKSVDLGGRRSIKKKNTILPFTLTYLSLAHSLLVTTFPALEFSISFIFCDSVVPCSLPISAYFFLFSLL